MRENYDGSLILAVAAYNAGPGNVNRWIHLNGDPREFSTFDATIGSSRSHFLKRETTCNGYWKT